MSKHVVISFLGFNISTYVEMLIFRANLNDLFACAISHNYKR